MGSNCASLCEHYCAWVCELCDTHVDQTAPYVVLGEEEGDIVLAHVDCMVEAQLHNQTRAKEKYLVD